MNDLRAADGTRLHFQRWPAPGAAERKSRLFDDRVVAIALARLQGVSGAQQAVIA